MPKQTEHRAEKLLERMQNLVSGNPIPYGEVVHITTTAHADGHIGVDITYNDGSHTDLMFGPETGAYDLAMDTHQAIDKACTEIRKARRALS